MDVFTFTEELDRVRDELSEALQREKATLADPAREESAASKAISASLNALFVFREALGSGDLPAEVLRSLDDLFVRE